MVLDRIKKVNDIKQLNEEELAELQEEIRDFLVENIAKTGGHLASNLGVVELTMAMHLVFDLPKPDERPDYLGCRTSVLHAQDFNRA